MQKLILPINRTKITASWKTSAYLNKFGNIHYGADLISLSGAADRKVYASGDGVVVGCGFDNVVGNVVAVLYLDAYDRATGRTEDIIIRYFHLASIKVAKWQEVNKDTLLGYYGATGMLNMSPHLHIEADKDISYPMYSPTVLSSNLIKGRAVGANDKTMVNPLQYFHCKSSKPDYQTYTTDGNSYIRTEDKKINIIN